MAKCIRCGRGGMGVIHQAIKLKDKNMICFRCYKELGRNPLEDLTTAPFLYTYEDLVGRPETVTERPATITAPECSSIGISFAHYGELRNLNATDEELEIFDLIREALVGTGPGEVELVRKSDSYLTARIGETDVARFKSTDRTKWILFPYLTGSKIRLSSPADVRGLSDKIVESAEKAREINNY